MTIEELVQSVAKRKTIVSNAIAFVEKEYSIENAANDWNRLLNKLNHGSFDFNPADTPTIFEKIANQLKFVLGHLTRPSSYKEAVRVLKRDGLKALTSRIIGNL